MPLYGSNQPKRMFIYGRLDMGPTILTPSYGFGWTLSGWLLTPFLQQAGMETMMRMRQRVLSNITTTFASSYKRKVNLEEMLTKVAEIYEEEAETLTSTLMSLLEPFLILGMALVVAFVVISILLPLLEMNQIVK